MTYSYKIGIIDRLRPQTATSVGLVLLRDGTQPARLVLVFDTALRSAVFDLPLESRRRSGRPCFGSALTPQLTKVNSPVKHRRTTQNVPRELTTHPG